MGYAGKPYPYVTCALRDAVTGDLLEGAAEGELVVRGPNVFAGYWRNDEATAEVFDGGWLRTGDVAERDAEGYYRIRGRLKEMFISGGENVYPAEIENVLAESADIAEVAVVGRPDERWGEAVVAVVVPAHGADVTATTVAALLAGRVARYKHPRDVILADALPRTALGKVKREELKRMARRESVAG
jgi:fatty-acyl-CoA synthase